MKKTWDPNAEEYIVTSIMELPSRAACAFCLYRRPRYHQYQAALGPFLSVMRPIAESKNPKREQVDQRNSTWRTLEVRHGGIASGDFDAAQLRGLVKKTKDGPQARRLLACCDLRWRDADRGGEESHGI